MSGEVLDLKLPHLVFLRLAFVRHGKLVLSCPKLKKAWFDETKQLDIRIEDAILKYLLLDYCDEVDLAISSPRIQLRNLMVLRVWQCSEVGRRLIENLKHMARFADMVYEDFPAACMPASFQQSLEHIQLHPLDWRHDLPEGLKELSRPTSFRFRGKRKFWKMTRPLAEFSSCGPPPKACIWVIKSMYVRGMGTSGIQSRSSKAVLHDWSSLNLQMRWIGRTLAK